MYTSISCDTIDFSTFPFAIEGVIPIFKNGSVIISRLERCRLWPMCQGILTNLSCIIIATFIPLGSNWDSSASWDCKYLTKSRFDYTLAVDIMYWMYNIICTILIKREYLPTYIINILTRGLCSTSKLENWRYAPEGSYFLLLNNRKTLE